MPLRPDYQQILLQHVAAETAHDMPATLATLTEDCIFEDVPRGEIYHGRERVRQFYSEWWDAFEIVPVTSERYYPAEDHLIVETHFQGVHKGSYRGIPPTGNKIDLPVAIFVRFAGGLMSGERFYYDLQTLLNQIGASRAGA
jgi:steroid delta-isomerase-like uncharacterized protein